MWCRYQCSCGILLNFFRTFCLIIFPLRCIFRDVTFFAFMSEIMFAFTPIDISNFMSEIMFAFTQIDISNFGRTKAMC